MDNGEEKEIRKEFLLDRLIFFSDAVFAIIITIMILDVKLPELAQNATEEESKNAFLQIIWKLLAYGVSFAIIGSFWMRHFKIFSFLKDFTKKLIVLNLSFLFSVSLFPFALSFWFSSSHIKHYSWGIYTFLAIILSAFFIQTLLIGHLVKNKAALCVGTHDVETELQWKSRRISYFTVPFLITLMIVAAWFNFEEYIVYLALLFVRLGTMKINRHYYPHHRKNKVAAASLPGARKRRLKHPIRTQGQ